MQKNILNIGGKEYEMRFPSLSQVKKVGRILDYDPISDPITSIKLDPFLRDDAKLLELLSALIVGEVKPSIVEDITQGDVAKAVVSFFVTGGMAQMKMSGGLASLENTMEQNLAKRYLDISESTSPSTQPAKATKG